MKRRTFLRHATHSLALPGLISSFGFMTPHQRRLNSFLRMASESDKVLVLIYLQGGNDGLNTVIPLDQLSALYSVRPHVVLPESKLLKITDSVALHPSLSGLKSLFREGKLEIIQSVGYPDQSFSHFRSTDIWMSGSGSNELVTSGWTGRYLHNEFPGFPEDYPNTTTPDPLAIELGYGASLLFQGPSAAMGTVINNPTAFYQLVNNVEEEAPDTNAGEKLKYVRLIARQSQQYGEVIKAAAENVTSQLPYPSDNELAQQLKIVARLIGGGLHTPLYLVRLGGFDTHDSQVESGDHTTGEHSSLLTKVNDAIIAFINDLEAMGVDDRVLGMTFSEFGRRIVSNASLGTDHGSAAPLFIFGNNVRGGVLGTNPVLSPNATYEDNLPIQFDFRQVYASVLEQWFESPPGTISDIMLGDFETVPIIRGSIVTQNERELDRSFSVYPNPVIDHVFVKFLSTGQAVNIQAIDLQGRKIQEIFTGSLPAGEHVIPWSTSFLPKGRYFVMLQNQKKKLVQSIVKN